MAESSVIGLLRVLLTADTAEFTPSMRKASQETEKVGESAKKTEKQIGGLSSGLSALTKAFDGSISGVQHIVGSTGLLGGSIGKIGGLVSGLASGFTALGPVVGGATLGVGAFAAALTAGAALAATAVGGIAAAVITLTTNAANAGDELLNLSNKTGLSVEALSKFQFVAQQTDTDINTITTAISKLGQNLATNSKDTVRAISAIGLSVADIRKMKPDEAFTTIMSAIGRIPDAGKRAAAGFAIFGKQFRQIAQLAKEDIKGLGDQVEAAGAVMTTEFAVAGDRFNDAVGLMSKAVTGLTNRL